MSKHNHHRIMQNGVIQEPIPDTTQIPETDVQEPIPDTSQIPETDVQEPDTDATQIPEVLNGFVDNCTRLNVRVAPNKNATVICELKKGEAVVVNEEESTDDFYKVYTATVIEGFCMKNFITI